MKKYFTEDKINKYMIEKFLLDFEKLLNKELVSIEKINNTLKVEAINLYKKYNIQEVFYLKKKCQKKDKKKIY